MRVRIWVTEHDLTNGKRMRCDACPIALAMNRALPGRRVEIFCCQAWLYRDGDNHPQMVALPREANRFVIDFDEGCPDVVPFDFSIEIG